MHFSSLSDPKFSFCAMLLSCIGTVGAGIIAYRITETI
jgi:hypothetical protein